MKKIFVSVIFLLFGLCSYSCDYSCPEPESLSSPASRFFSTVTCQKALSETIGEKIINKSISNNVSTGKIKTDIKAHSAKDLKAGKFKSIELTGREINVQDIYISYFHAKTLCDYNYIGQNENGDVIIKDDIPFAVEIELTEEDLNKNMQSVSYKNLISEINKFGGTFSVFHINSTNLKLKGDKVYYVIEYTIPFVREPKNIVIVSDLNIKDGVIVFDNSKIYGNALSFDVNKISSFFDYINPLDFSLNIQNNRDIKVNIKNVRIEEAKIIADGILTVLKDKE